MLIVNNGQKTTEREFEQTRIRLFASNTLELK